MHFEIEASLTYDFAAPCEVLLLVDPSGLAPLDGLVRVATGRDAADIAFMTIFSAATLVEQHFRIDRVGG